MRFQAGLMDPEGEGADNMGPDAYGLMVETVSEDCNLACDYRYYSRVKGRPKRSASQRRSY